MVYILVNSLLAVQFMQMTLRHCLLHAMGCYKVLLICVNNMILEMWANAQRDGRPAEYRWRPLFNAAKFG